MREAQNIPVNHDRNETQLITVNQRKTETQTRGVNHMGLRAKQSEFAKELPHLLNKAHELGFEVTLGDGYRDPRVFGQVGERRGYGSPQSAHKQRLAIDLNLFRAGKYLGGTKDHQSLGEWWESQGGIWGGRFDDGNHYQWPTD